MTKRDPNKKPRLEIRDRKSPLSTRFLNRVQKSDGCWLWVGPRGRLGYGVLTHHYERLLAHRLSYELHVGPIADGLVVCHRCDNPPCVNPAHLFIGTQSDNVYDMHAKGRQSGGSMKGESHMMHVLTEQQVKEIKGQLSNYRWGDCQRLADIYGVARCTISAIKMGHKWKHVP